MSFSTKIEKWYAANKRDLPWRSTRDPYKIWLSEIMLQQTRVAQGLPYYLKFLTEFPTVWQLAAANEKKVLKLWQGLGYYSRARNMHATARFVANELQGQFPDTYGGLIKLKGIGDYTASAIASVCFDRREPVVDGNVYRVLARYFGVDTPIDSPAGITRFKDLAREVMPASSPGEYNQAIMEFGATMCTPARPGCDICPLSNGCAARSLGMVSSLPVKRRKPPVKKRYFNYLVPLDADRNTHLKQRGEKGIWQQLYEFPLLESEVSLDENTLRERIPEPYTSFDNLRLELVNTKEIVHKLSHQHLYTRFWVLELDGSLKEGIPVENLDSYPVPVLIADFIKTYKNSYF
jgi:A/G-specific adenine glycosylase